MALSGAVLILDDEEYVRESLAAVLSRRGYVVRTASRGAEILAEHALDGVEALFTDLRMPATDVPQLIRSVLEASPGLPIIVLTAFGTVPSAVECMRAGAYEYLLKPANPDELILVLERAIGQRTLRRELDYLRRAGPDGGGDRKIIGQSPPWQRVLELVEMAAPADTSVLLLGESGTGKEEIAHRIHERSKRSGRALVSVNCAAIPLELFESEFFGHRRGAFTGALANRDGRFLVAHQGTLFMDEIACLPGSAQAKVLRVLEDGSFERLGDTRPSRADVRLIAATNVELGAAVEAGRFRRDLYHRINVMTIELPPLRERREDIPELALHFLADRSAHLGKDVRTIHPRALDTLCRYDWPGNVRELRNVIERGVLVERAHELSPSALAIGAPPEKSESLSLREVVAQAERHTLEQALHRAAGVRREAARLLGIDERNLAYYLRKHGLMERMKP